MAISQTNYVDITSAVAGASATGSPSLQHPPYYMGAVTRRRERRLQAAA